MNLDGKYSGKDSLFYILPIGYEKDLTYGKGGAKGSGEIIKASLHLEYYDEQFDNEPFEKGIHTLDKLELNDFKPEEAIERISEEVAKYKDKFLISLGGDHAVTIGIVNGLDRNYDNFDVIILDAHADFFHSWNNSQFNHRCVAQRAAEKHKTLLIGVRAMDKDEKEIIEKNKNVNLIKAYDYEEEKLKKLLKELNKDVYLSIDADVFDPSFIRNTGTPEPGGFFWNDVINILKIIFTTKNVIGADIAEFAPNENFGAEAFSLAKLCYKMAALRIIYDKSNVLR